MTILEENFQQIKNAEQETIRLFHQAKKAITRSDQWTWYYYIPASIVINLGVFFSLFFFGEFEPIWSLYIIVGTSCLAICLPVSALLTEKKSSSAQIKYSQAAEHEIRAIYGVYNSPAT